MMNYKPEPANAPAANALALSLRNTDRPAAIRMARQSMAQYPEDPVAPIILHDLLTDPTLYFDLEPKIVDGTGQMEISPDNQYLLMERTDGVAEVWSITGELCAVWNRESARIERAQWLPCSRRIALWCEDWNLQIWDVQVDEVFQLGKVSEIVASDPESPHWLTISADENVKLWNPDGTLLRTLNAGGYAATCVAVCPAKHFFATGHENGVVKVWNSEGELIQSFEGHSGEIKSIKFAPDGASFLVALNDARLIYWWGLDGRLWNKVECNSLSRGVFAPDSSWMYLYSRDRWHPNMLLKPYQPAVESFNHYHFSPDATFLIYLKYDEISKSKIGTLCDRHLNPVQHYDHEAFEDIHRLEWLPDQQFAVFVRHQEKAYLFDFKGNLIKALPCNGLKVFAVQRLLAISRKTKTIFQEINSPERILWEGEDQVLALSDDACYLWTKRKDCYYIWKQQFDPVQQERKFQRIVFSVQYVEENRFLVFEAAWELHLLDWSTNHRQVLWGSHPKQNARFNYAASPDGSRILVLSYLTEAATVIDLAGNILVQFACQEPLHSFNPRAALSAFNPVQPLILLPNGELRSEDGSFIRLFREKSENVLYTTWSPDGQTALTVCDDAQVRLWSLDGALKLVLASTDHVATTIAIFSPDGQFVFTGNSEDFVFQWNMTGTVLQVRKMPDTKYQNPNVNKRCSLLFSPDGQALLIRTNSGDCYWWYFQRRDAPLFKSLSVVQFLPGTGQYLTVAENNRVQLRLLPRFSL